MQKLITAMMALYLLIFSAISVAGQHPPPLNEVYLQVAMEEWVKTKTAKVVISINATASRQGLSKIRGEMLKSLNSIAKADWQFTNFNRSQDQSGLEQIYATAEARIDEQYLGGLYSNAETASKPGTKYRIGSVEFRPSLSETEAVREAVRVKLYERIREEVKRIRAVYPDQDFQIHKINFIPEMGGQVVRHMKMMGRANMESFDAGVAAPAAISVSEKVTMNAIVVIANQMPPVKPH